MFLCNAGKLFNALVFINSHTSRSWDSEEHILSKKNVNVNPLKSEWVRARDSAKVRARRCGAVAEAAAEGTERGSPPGQPPGLVASRPRWSLHPLPPVTPKAGLSRERKVRKGETGTVAQKEQLQDHICALMAGKSPFPAFDDFLLRVGCGNRFWDALEEKSVLYLRILLGDGTHWEEFILFSLAHGEKNASVLSEWQKGVKVVIINVWGFSEKDRSGSDSLLTPTVGEEVCKGIPVKISISHTGMVSLLQTGSHSTETGLRSFFYVFVTPKYLAALDK